MCKLCEELIESRVKDERDQFPIILNLKPNTDFFGFPSEESNKIMNEKQLLEFFDIHKNGQVDIRHAWTEKIYNTSISLEDLFEMFRLYLIRRDNAVTQD